MNLINWLRQPDRYWLWVGIGQNKYEGAILELRVLLTQKHVDDFVESQIAQRQDTTIDDYELVKVKTNPNELTDSFLTKFLYDGDNPRDQIISLQRYRTRRGKDTEFSAATYLSTFYLFEVKAHDY